MKKTGLIIGCLVVIFSNYSCEPKQIVPNFKDRKQMTIYDYIVAHKDQYSSFLSILEKGRLDKTLTAYNPNGIGYTLFLPDNEAIDQFIQESGQYASLNDLLNDTAYVYALSRYHVVDLGIDANDFPFGALPALTLSGDYLTVNFVIGTDSSYYLINNQAPVKEKNIELSNGFIHTIGRALIPITYTSYGWLVQHPGYSIFKEAVEATGLAATIDINIKEAPVGTRSFTMLIEHDSVFNKAGIYSLQDLEDIISPGNTDYTDVLNPLYNFVAYHILTDTKFLDDFADVSSNYSTYSDIPVGINGKGLDIMINKGKETFDTIVESGDTTYIDYIGFYYDESNILTQSGALHFIDRVLKQQSPSIAEQVFEFWEEPLLNSYRQETAGTYLLEDTALLNYVKWSGADLSFVKTADLTLNAWTHDYLYISGDFKISYTMPKLVQGNYTVYLAAEAYNTGNALIEVYLDGQKMGRLIDLPTAGGSAAYPFNAIELGTVNFLKYEAHTIEIRSLIPGKFSWDYVRFEPVIK
jgi:uncharacterized surface protein with fasciclin (FAS1) repeats